MRGNDCCHKIHHCADRRVFTQVAVNHEPDVAREGRNVLIDPDEIGVSLREKAGQAGHTHPGPRRDQVFADVVQFARHRPIAGNTEQPPLLRHVGVALIEGNKLPSFGRGQMRVGPMCIETEGHCPDLARYAARFIRPHEPHGDVGFAPAQRNLLSLRGERKPEVGIVRAEARQLLGEKMRDQNWRCAERDPADKWSMGGLRQAGDAMGSSLHFNGPLEHLPSNRGEAAGSWQTIDKPHVKRGLKGSKPPADRRMVHSQAASGRRERTVLGHSQEMPGVFPIDHLCEISRNTGTYTEFPHGPHEPTFEAK